MVNNFALKQRYILHIFTLNILQNPRQFQFCSESSCQFCQPSTRVLKKLLAVGSMKKEYLSRKFLKRTKNTKLLIQTIVVYIEYYDVLLKIISASNKNI